MERGLPRWLPSIPASVSTGLHWREVEDRRDGKGTRGVMPWMKDRKPT